MAVFQKEGGLTLPSLPKKFSCKLQQHSKFISNLLQGFSPCLNQAEEDKQVSTFCLESERDTVNNHLPLRILICVIQDQNPKNFRLLAEQICGRLLS